MERDKDVVTTQMVSHLRVPDHAASQKTVLLKLRRVVIAFFSVAGCCTWARCEATLSGALLNTLHHAWFHALDMYGSSTWHITD